MLGEFRRLWRCKLEKLQIAGSRAKRPTLVDVQKTRPDFQVSDGNEASARS